MELIYPNTKIPAFEDKVESIDWLYKVRDCLILLNMEVIHVSMASNIASELNMNEDVVKLALKSFGDMFAKNDKEVLLGDEYEEVFKEIMTGRSQKYKNYDVFWHVGMPD